MPCIAIAAARAETGRQVEPCGNKALHTITLYLDHMFFPGLVQFNVTYIMQGAQAFGL